MKLEFHPDAAEEFGAAVDYYEAAVSGLGNRFLVAVREATDLALANPEIGRPRGSARRLGVPGFPYDVAYRVRDGVSKCWRLLITIAVPDTGGSGASAFRRTA